MWLIVSNSYRFLESITLIDTVLFIVLASPILSVVVSYRGKLKVECKKYKSQTDNTYKKKKMNFVSNFQDFLENNKNNMENNSTEKSDSDVVIVDSTSNDPMPRLSEEG